MPQESGRVDYRAWGCLLLAGSALALPPSPTLTLMTARRRI